MGTDFQNGASLGAITAQIAALKQEWRRALAEATATIQRGRFDPAAWSPAASDAAPKALS